LNIRQRWRYRAGPDAYDELDVSKGMSIFDRLLRKPDSGSASSTTDADALNAALVAYVHTFPQQERLAAHLEQRGKLEERAQIEATLQIALQSTERYLYAQAEGVRWSTRFEAELFEHVARSSPWLSPQAFRSLVSFGAWLCWHEGLNAGPDV